MKSPSKHIKIVSRECTYFQKKTNAPISYKTISTDGGQTDRRTDRLKTIYVCGWYTENQLYSLFTYKKTALLVHTT